MEKIIRNESGISIILSIHHPAEINTSAYEGLFAFISKSKADIECIILDNASTQNLSPHSQHLNSLLHTQHSTKIHKNHSLAMQKGKSNSCVQIKKYPCQMRIPVVLPSLQVHTQSS